MTANHESNWGERKKMKKTRGREEDMEDEEEEVANRKKWKKRRTRKNIERIVLPGYSSSFEFRMSLRYSFHDSCLFRTDAQRVTGVLHVTTCNGQH